MTTRRRNHCSDLFISELFFCSMKRKRTGESARERLVVAQEAARIIDPAYTVPLFIALIGILMMRDRGGAQKLNLSMLTLSTIYLIWSVGAKSMIDQKVQFALTARGIHPDVYESAPAPFNTLLWRAVAVEDETYYEIWASVFDAVDDIQVRQFDRSLTLLKPIENHPSVRRLQWFTKGQYKAWQEDDVIYLSDLRMGIEGAYVFNFEVGRRSG